jgi:hypothetical protein
MSNIQGSMLCAISSAILDPTNNGNALIEQQAK